MKKGYRTISSNIKTSFKHDNLILKEFFLFIQPFLKFKEILQLKLGHSKQKSF